MGLTCFYTAGGILAFLHLTSCFTANAMLRSSLESPTATLHPSYSPLAQRIMPVISICHLSSRLSSRPVCHLPPAYFLGFESQTGISALGQGSRPSPGAVRDSVSMPLMTALAVRRDFRPCTSLYHRSTKITSRYRTIPAPLRPRR